MCSAPTSLGQKCTLPGKGFQASGATGLAVKQETLLVAGKTPVKCVSAFPFCKLGSCNLSKLSCLPQITALGAGQGVVCAPLPQAYPRSHAGADRVLAPSSRVNARRLQPRGGAQ